MNGIRLAGGCKSVPSRTLRTLAAVMHLGNGVPQKAGYVQCVVPELKSLTEATPKLEYKVANAIHKVEKKLREPEEGTDAWGCQETSRGGDN